MDSPYSLLEEVGVSRRAEGSRVPWGEANTNSRDFYNKKANDNEIAAYLLLDQTDHYTPRTFSDPVSNEFVSISKSTNSEKMSGVFINDQDIDLDSLLKASAQRALVGDDDTHREQFAVTPTGEIYTFDFGFSGYHLSEVFADSDTYQNSWSINGGMVRAVASYVNQLGLNEKLESQEPLNQRGNLEEKIAYEITERMREMAQDIDIEEFISEAKEDSRIDYFEDSHEDPCINNMVYNVEKAKDGRFGDILPSE